MITVKELTNGYSVFSIYAFVFKSQTNVVLKLDVVGGEYRLSKKDLIGAIRFYLNSLSNLGLGDKIKSGFNLEAFKYYELSVYLHGILQVYCSTLGFSPIGELSLTRFSHLPHDVMKSEKIDRHIEISYLKDGYAGSSIYCCVIAGVPLCADTYEGLKNRISHVFSGFVKKYNIVLDVK